MKAKIKEELEKILNSIKRKAKIGILLAGATIPNFNNNCLGDYKNGKLEIQNWVGDSANFPYGLFSIVHYERGIEGYYGTPDLFYVDPPFWMTPNIMKIISKVDGYELRNDTRPPDSLTPVNLELALHSEHNTPINVSNYLENWLVFVLDPNKKDWTFEPKPITYRERDANDPNLFYLVANVRKEIAQNGGIIPLPDLNGTYDSQVPYLRAQLSFSDHFVHLNDDDIVDLKDYAIFANAYDRKGITDVNRADPNDLGAWADYDLDGDVDVNDLSIFTDYYLTSKTYHLEDGWILE